MLFILYPYAYTHFVPTQKTVHEKALFRTFRLLYAFSRTLQYLVYYQIYMSVIPFFIYIFVQELLFTYEEDIK